ncbi:hypothetical protein BpHYR1_043315 [Brachionus plicatilis]|uniref:Uncharacterized protein n=1 Tax=Brachionus plicatilis TaxID=10195 RepID=A0A3M7QID3_BRAPC|nr:hypothetical protein BpHYR1_043315 [Brachionus plicatilis]
MAGIPKITIAISSKTALLTCPSVSVFLLSLNKWFTFPNMEKLEFSKTNFDSLSTEMNELKTKSASDSKIKTANFGHPKERLFWTQMNYMTTQWKSHRSAVLEVVKRQAAINEFLRIELRIFGGCENSTTSIPFALGFVMTVVSIRRQTNVGYFRIIPISNSTILADTLITFDCGTWLLISGSQMLYFPI